VEIIEGTLVTPDAGDNGKLYIVYSDAGASAGANQSWTLDLRESYPGDPYSGQFTIFWGAVESDPIEIFNTANDQTAMNAALEEILGPGNFVLNYPGGGNFTIVLQGDLASQEFPDDELSIGDPGPILNYEKTVVNITAPGAPTGGDWTFTVNGQTTAPIAFDADETAFLAALEALSNVDPGDVFVMVNPNNTYQMFWQGQYLGTNMTTSANFAGLTGGMYALLTADQGGEVLEDVTLSLQQLGSERKGGLLFPEGWAASVGAPVGWRCELAVTDRELFFQRNGYIFFDAESDTRIFDSIAAEPGEWSQSVDPAGSAELIYMGEAEDAGVEVWNGIRNFGFFSD
jgi:hypothetical protein